MEPSIEDLKDVVRLCPAIDNHAHNLLKPSHQDSYSLLSATTEATGHALQDTPRSLPHLRMVRQLRELYGCDSNTGWEQLMDKRQELLTANAMDLHQKCFETIHTILMDDGLDDEDVHPYHWHDLFTQAKTLRIVRIETVAANILRSMHKHGRLNVDAAMENDEICAQTWISFLSSFETAIANFIRDDEVVGFKSVICYRTGLDVQVAPDVEIATNGLEAFRDDFLPDCVRNGFRIDAKGLNDCILISTCRLLTAGFQQDGIAKPLQFHTGLGDNNISLLRSNPAYMQTLIEKFPEVLFILLHSSYPYTREAGYLATVFKNVYLDLGEVFPMVSRDGQENIIRQAMELTPVSKLLYSTDAHHWAETYWLANKQFRQAFERVLVEYVENEDLTVQQAINAAQDIFFNNSSSVYSLGLDLPDMKKKPLQLAWKDPPRSVSPKAALKINPYDLALAHSFSQAHHSVQFVYVQWLDYMATMRARIFPLRQFMEMIEDGSRFSIARGNLGTLQNDQVTSAVTQGHILVEPDLSTLRPTHSKDPLQSASVIACFRDDSGNELPACPRSSLVGLLNSFHDRHGIDVLAGFEIELVFLKQTSDEDYYGPSDTNHAWATLTPDQHATTIPILAEIVGELEMMEIYIEQFHSESGAGQYELVMAPLPPVVAIDTLIQARQVIYQIAHSHGLRATLHPVPLDGVGSGQHVHLSLNSTSLSDTEVEKKGMSFFASVLEHLPSICAFSLPNEVSYERVKDNYWTGGTWCCWGTQNREVPLRHISSAHWEIRCIDGLANPYLALSAILAVGLAGIEGSKQMSMEDCLENPAILSEEQRKDLGIVQRMPLELEDALDTLQTDELLTKMMGFELVSNYVTMKRAEQSMLNKMSKEEQRLWLVKRY